MNKNILIISSSPRRHGNSDILCDEFLNGAQSVGHNVEKIFLKDYKINYCTGCGLCVNNSGTCSQKDDMHLIMQKMIAANVIVLATPIYFYTMCGQLKTFIDRNCFFYTELKNKEFYYIMTAADTAQSTMDKTIAELEGYVGILAGAKIKDMILATDVYSLGDIKHSKKLQESFEIGSKV